MASPAALQKSGKDGETPTPVKAQPTSPKLAVSLAVFLLKLLRFIAPYGVATLGWRLLAVVIGYHSWGVRSSKPSRWYNYVKRILDGWFVAESVFYFFSSWRKMEVQQRNDAVVHMSAEDRRVLFERCLDSIDDPREFASSWMRNHPFEQLRIGNIEQWLAWGIFSRTTEELRGEHRRIKASNKPSNLQVETEWDQLQWALRRIEKATNHKFLPGYDGNARGMRFTLEPVETTHRPLVYYGVVQGLFQNLIVPTYMRMNGFSLKKNDKGGLHCWVRKAHTIAGRAPGPNHETPIVFLHGIGVGLLPYLGFVRNMIQASNGDSNANTLAGEDISGRPLVFVELPIISQNFTSHANGVLLRDDFARDMRELLVQHAGFKNGACFIGHSFGTVCLSWLVSRAPDLLRGLVFVDPVVFLLHKTNALQAICYKEPVKESDQLMHYIMRTEITFSAFTRRHFTWYANVLFVEQIPSSCPTVVILSDKDAIVPTREVSAYLARKNRKHIACEVFENATHGEYLFNPKVGEQVMQHIKRVACSSGEN